MGMTFANLRNLCYNNEENLFRWAEYSTFATFKFYKE